MFASLMTTGARPAMSSAMKMPCWKPRCASCRPGTMSHRVDARQVRAQPLVGADEAAFELHAGLFEAVASGVRAAADGNQHDVGLELLAVLQADGDAGVGLLRAGELHAGLELDAAPAEGPLQALGDELVLVGDQVRQRFDDRDFSAEGTPHAG